MTVESSVVLSGPFTGNGTTTNFPRDFSIGAADHVYVTIDGVAFASGYTVLTPENVTGDVQFDTAPADGVEIYLTRVTPVVQNTDYSAQGTVSPEQVERDLDQITRIFQEQKRDLSRAIVLPYNTPDTVPREMEVPQENKALYGGPNGEIKTDGVDITDLNSANANAIVATTKAAEAVVSAAQAAIYSTLATRNLANMTAVAALDDGQVATMDGLTYVADSATTLANSVGNDLGVAGVLAYGPCYPAHCGDVGGGADDQAIFAAWMGQAMRGRHCHQDAQLRITEGLSLTLSARVKITSTADATITMTSSTHDDFIAYCQCAGNHFDVSFGQIDANSKFNQGIVFVNGGASADDTATGVIRGTKVSNLYGLAANASSANALVISGGFESAQLLNCQAISVGRESAGGMPCQALVLSYDLANGKVIKHAAVKNCFVNGVRGDDWATVGDNDGIVIFQDPAETEGSTVLEDNTCVNCVGRDMKLGCVYPVVDRHTSIRSWQSHHAGHLVVNFLFGTGILRNTVVRNSGASVYQSGLDVIATFFSGTVIGEDMNAIRLVDGLSITSAGTGATYGLEKIVDFYGGVATTADPQWTCGCYNVKMAGGFSKYGIGVFTLGGATRPADIAVSGFTAKITVAFAAASAPTPELKMIILGARNQNATSIPVILRQDGVGMVGSIGDIKGAGNTNIDRSLGLFSDTVAGYAPMDSLYVPTPAGQSQWVGSFPVFAGTVNSGDADVEITMKFPCILDIVLGTTYETARVQILSNGGVTVIKSTTYLAAQAGSEPAGSYYKLWTDSGVLKLTTAEAADRHIGITAII